MFRSKGILIALLIECILAGVVYAQSGSQINNKKARYVLSKILATREKMKNLQFEYEQINWRNLDIVNTEHFINPMNDTIYAKHSIVLDCNGLEKNDYHEYGIVDSSGKKVPVETLLRNRAWDGHTGVEHNHHGGSPGRAILDDSPPYTLKNTIQPWRAFTGLFAELLADTIDEAKNPVNVVTLPDGKYRVSFIYSLNGLEYVGVIDPAKGFTCPNMTMFRDGIKSGYRTAECEEFADGVWFPVTGEGVGVTSDGVVRNKRIFKMSNIKVNDPNFNEDLFHVDLPEGTKVTDKVLGIRYVVGDSMSNKVHSGANIDKAMTDQQINSLVGKPVPRLKDFNHKIDVDQTRDRMILLCFFDMEQRPSRNFIMRLAKQARQLKQKGVTVVAVQASKIDENKLNEWVKKNNIPFPIGMVQGDVEKTRFAWGVRSLPWLILTDKEHIVRAEGFGINELDEKITTLRK
ncbi:MAG: redoxin domain-containing protein [Planctomycetes bacterium]|nr:redoxin domain-containing protein [Planctomycetota bacterium]